MRPAKPASKLQSRIVYINGRCIEKKAGLDLGRAGLACNIGAGFVVGLFTNITNLMGP